MNNNMNNNREALQSARPAAWRLESSTSAVVAAFVAVPSPNTAVMPASGARQVAIAAAVTSDSNGRALSPRPHHSRLPASS